MTGADTQPPAAAADTQPPVAGADTQPPAAGAETGPPASGPDVVPPTPPPAGADGAATTPPAAGGQAATLPAYGDVQSVLPWADEGGSDGSGITLVADTPTTPDTADSGRSGGSEADVSRWADDGSDVVTVEARPPDLDALGTVMENAREIQPHDMPTADVAATTTADATTGPGTATGPETTPGPDGGAGSDGAGGDDPGTGAQGAGDVNRWADDGSDVVTVEARPPDLDALGTVMENAREIQPHDMPAISVPDGAEWGKGDWAPMDIEPDGPAGSVTPGDPSKPIPPPGS
ncbi:hypothetical protein HNP84_007784 [Thermocatellispora tengchongensis]|uniref:Uncharacterized protein n=1 Tax=Thermocatellispora tengchongensis TaxID=1073253 RepID=A0A840PJN9_9ACTN|nr:hypothetical protein [Thermocatellispora tengchongensis]MBB5138031.1 hypothetical protein [Thermocatellispora tengchongensis]